MMKINITRRKFLTSSAVVAVSQIATKAFAAEPTTKATTDQVSTSEDYTYEVNYTDAEWKERLTEAEFTILREGETEEAKSSPLWKEKREGLYHCKGCELTVYESKEKTVLSKGWVFFRHSKPDTVLTGIDLFTHYSRGEPKEDKVIESHCRRCGSHLGHILYINKQILHCINGASLIFKPTV
ncbi:peptide-methionine (R)-S-oxide reductase [Psychromonas arctica]|uniref:peptide-methionine (R)-S-oxide reductase n=1 Tax=Psychromonas arctica TaxID=168275 RepID=A0ABU9HEE0_9GAMM